MFSLCTKIVSLQSLHYLTLSVMLPPLLYTFSDSRALSYTHGGVATVGMVMDWREMASKSTAITDSSSSGSTFWSWVPASSDPFPFLGHGDMDAHVSPDSDNSPKAKEIGGWRTSIIQSLQEAKNAGIVTSGKKAPAKHDGAEDSRRGWIIGASWLLASAIEYALQVPFLVLQLMSYSMSNLSAFWLAHFTAYQYYIL